ncbi:NAD(P)H-binding protein [Enterococcus casseliflavus]|uniref:NAD(P)-dependent oxidoreductase n=1 Tax=Enterococcus casseliflavus TaxID=37734 RepID=UPI002FBD9927
MEIGIIGATGKLGTILTEKLIQRGEKPVGIIRNRAKLNVNIPFIEKDIFDLTTQDIDGFDIVINTFNAPLNDPDQFISSTDHLIDILKGTDTYLLFAGGAGVLLVDDTTMLVDTPEIPTEFKPIAEAEVEAFKHLRNETNINWTYMAPPALMDYEAPFTGEYKFSGNRLGVNEEGNSFISYKDYAEAFITKVYAPEKHRVVGVFS